MPTNHKSSDDEQNTLSHLFDKIRSKVIKCADIDGPLFAGPGGRVEWQLSFHDFFVDPEALDLFSDEFWRRYAPCAPLQIGGVETSGIPLVIAVVQKAQQLGLGARGFFVRKERKQSGLCRSIDGDLNDWPIVVVDDAIKTGNSVERARVALASVGKAMHHVCVLFEFGWTAGEEWAKNNDVRVQSFFTPADFGLLDDRNQVHANDRRATAKIIYEPLWHFAAPNPLPTHIYPKSAPVLVGNSLFFGADCGVFWALDAMTGNVLWKFDAKVNDEKGIWSTPCYKSGYVTFGAFNGNLYHLSADTGEVVWVSAVGDQCSSSPTNIVGHGLLSIGSSYSRCGWKGGIAVLDGRTGEKVWEWQLRAPQHGAAAYSHKHSLLVVGSSDNAILALEPTTGKSVWQCPTEGAIKFVPYVDDEIGVVMTSCDDGRVRINDLMTGELRSQIDTLDSCVATPLLRGSRVYCGSTDRGFYVADVQSGEIVRRIDTRGRIFAPAVPIDGNVMFGNSAGVLEEVNACTLETESAVMLPDAITNAVAVSDDESRIYVPTYLNEIYAMRRVRAD